VGSCGMDASGSGRGQ